MKKENSMTFSQTKQGLKLQAKENGLEWADEVDTEVSNEVEFLLGYRWRWLLCHISKSAPYYVRYRLIGERLYEKVKPQNFVTLAKEKLLH